MCPLAEPDPNQRGIPFLDKYAQERWDTVLHFMVKIIVLKLIVFLM